MNSFPNTDWHGSRFSKKYYRISRSAWSPWTLTCVGEDWKELSENLLWFGKLQSYENHKIKIKAPIALTSANWTFSVKTGHFFINTWRPEDLADSASGQWFRSCQPFWPEVALSRPDNSSVWSLILHPDNIVYTTYT